MPDKRKIYDEPFRAFRFLVEMEIAGQSSVVAGFSQFSGVSMRMDVIKARSCKETRGVQQTIPVFTRYEPVTLSKGVVGDNEFMDWLFSAAAGLETGAKGENLCRTLRIIVLDDKGRRGIEWTLKDAMPMSYTLAPMDSNSSVLLSERITFSIGGIARTTNIPPEKQSEAKT